MQLGGGISPQISLVDARVSCGSVFRYRAFQDITAEGKKAYELEIGDVLPDLGLPDVKPPCKCQVVDVVCR